MTVVIASIIADCESFGVVCVGVARDVLKARTCASCALIPLLMQRDVLLLLVPVVYTINNPPIRKRSFILNVRMRRRASEYISFEEHQFAIIFAMRRDKILIAILIFSVNVLY